MDCRRVTASDETRICARGPAGKTRDQTRACRNRTKRASPVAAAVKRPAGPCHRMGVHTAVCNSIKTIALALRANTVSLWLKILNLLIDNRNCIALNAHPHRDMTSEVGATTRRRGPMKRMNEFEGGALSTAGSPTPGDVRKHDTLSRKGASELARQLQAIGTGKDIPWPGSGQSP